MNRIISSAAFRKCKKCLGSWSTLVRMTCILIFSTSLPAFSGEIISIQDPTSLFFGCPCTYKYISSSISNGIPFGINTITFFNTWEESSGGFTGMRVQTTDQYTLDLSTPQTGPNQGNSKQPSLDPATQLFYQSIRDKVSGQHDKQKRFNVRTPSATLGERGSIDVDINAVNLTEGSPGYYSFLASNKTTSILFMVEHAAPGDYMSVYTPNGMVWNQPLDSFSTNVIYSMEIPEATNFQTGATELISVWLQGIGDLSSSVDLIDGISYSTGDPATPVPTPASLPLLGIGIAADALSRKKQ